MRSARILLADNDSNFRDATAQLLERHGYTVIKASTPDEARSRFRESLVDLAVVDLRLEDDNNPYDVSGVALVREFAPHVPTILFTGAELAPPLYGLLVEVVSKLRRFDALLDAIRRNLIPRVFVAHGHRGLAEITLCIEHLGLRVETLKEDMSIDVLLLSLDGHANADRTAAAVVVLAADDEGYSVGKPKEKKARARQNVVFEWGYLIAKLGLGRVIPVVEPGLELPSNYQGIKAIRMDPSYGWKAKLEAALTETGIDVALYKRQYEERHAH